MSKVSIGAGAPFDPVVVDLWGHEFNTVPVTRSVAKRLGEHERKLSEEEDPDLVVELIAAMLDEHLKPSNGKRTKPSSIIKEKWEADELSLPQLTQLSADLADAGRPT